jgi:molybdate transport repressor ModE-like protein
MSDNLESRKKSRLPTRAMQRACDLELRQLRAFVALIDEGSVTGAARALALSQSTVSEALAALERSLGTSVLRRRRGTHDSVLTPAGQALLSNARELLAGVEKTYIAVAEAAVQARGALNIVANESVSTYLLPRPLAQLRAHWPNTRFSVSVAVCAGVQHGIEDGTCDVGLILQKLTQGAALSRIRTKKAVHDDHVLAPVVPLVIFATPAHPLAVRKQPGHIPKSDLSDLVMFVSDPAGEFHDLIRNFLLEDGMPTARLQSAGSIEGVKRGVAADPRAVGILPIYAIREELRAGRVVRLDINPAPPAMQLVALLSNVQEHHPGALELLDRLKQALMACAEPGLAAGDPRTNAPKVYRFLR